MKINIISKNEDLIGFTSALAHAGHEVKAVNQIEPCDILIYDVEFKKDVPKIDGIKIENYNDPNQEVDDDFSISFVNKNVSYNALISAHDCNGLGLSIGKSYIFSSKALDS